MVVNEPLYIDASVGEPSGLIVRAAMVLSATQQRAIKITKIRTQQAKPGLRHQHLCVVRALAQICGGELTGAKLNSTDLHFVPGPVTPGAYCFVVDKPGSASLVLQSILLPLVLAKGDSQVALEGGTHNAGAPCYDFIERGLIPVLRSMGAHIELSLERPGFVAGGEGRILLNVKGGSPLLGLDLIEAGELMFRRATALVCNLPGTIAIRELHAARDLLEWKNEECLPRVFGDCEEQGNVLILEMQFAKLCELISVVGERHLSAEEVGLRAGEAMRNYLAHGAPVGAALAEQLIMAFALAGQGQFRTGPLSPAAQASVELCRAFLPTTIELVETGGSTLLRFEKAAE